MPVTVLGMIVPLQPATSMLLAIITMALHPLRLSYTALSLSTMIDERALHDENAPMPMLSTDPGMLIAVRALQPEKAPSPIVVTELGIVTEVSALHP